MLNLMISCDYHAQLYAEHTVHVYMLALPSTPIILLFPTQFDLAFLVLRYQLYTLILKVFPDFDFCIFIAVKKLL